VVTAILAIRFSPALRRAIAAASLPALIKVRFYRTLGVVFVILVHSRVRFGARHR
jgi:hypothetical protein